MVFPKHILQLQMIPRCRKYLGLIALGLINRSKAIPPHTHVDFASCKSFGNNILCAFMTYTSIISTG